MLDHLELAGIEPDALALRAGVDEDVPVLDLPQDAVALGAVIVRGMLFGALALGVQPRAMRLDQLGIELEEVLILVAGLPELIGAGWLEIVHGSLRWRGRMCRCAARCGLRRARGYR